MLHENFDSAKIFHLRGHTEIGSETKLTTMLRGHGCMDHVPNFVYSAARFFRLHTD